MDHDGLIALIARRSKDAPILVQPLIKNHPGLADLAELALMRMRVITCLDQGGNPVLTHAVLSNLCKLETNWPTDIELGAAVDLESGALGMMTGRQGRRVAGLVGRPSDHPRPGAGPYRAVLG